MMGLTWASMVIHLIEQARIVEGELTKLLYKSASILLAIPHLWCPQQVIRLEDREDKEVP
jgi:hypothetical protein